MNNILTLAITASLLGGCATSGPSATQQINDHNAKAFDKTAAARKESNTRYDKEQESVSKQKETALAVMDSIDPYSDSTKMRIRAAAHCQKEVSAKGPAHPEYRLCMSTVELAESAKRRDHEHIERLKKDLAADYDKNLRDIADRHAAANKELDRIYAEAVIQHPTTVYPSAPSAGYAYASGNPYGTPSPSLYMAPGPGTSITAFGPDMWTARGTSPGGRATTCNGAYGVVSCY